MISSDSTAQLPPSPGCGHAHSLQFLLDSWAQLPLGEGQWPVRSEVGWFCGHPISGFMRDPHPRIGGNRQRVLQRSFPSEGHVGMSRQPGDQPSGWEDRRCHRLLGVRISLRFSLTPLSQPLSVTSEGEIAESPLMAGRRATAHILCYIARAWNGRAWGASERGPI